MSLSVSACHVKLWYAWGHFLRFVHWHVVIRWFCVRKKNKTKHLNKATVGQNSKESKWLFAYDGAFMSKYVIRRFFISQISAFNRQLQTFTHPQFTDADTSYSLSVFIYVYV